MPAPSRIEAFAIISADGMIADAAGHMPDALKIEADQKFSMPAWIALRWSYMGGVPTRVGRTRRGAVY